MEIKKNKNVAFAKIIKIVVNDIMNALKSLFNMKKNEMKNHKKEKKKIIDHN